MHQPVKGRKSKRPMLGFQWKYWQNPVGLHYLKDWRSTHWLWSEITFTASLRLPPQLSWQPMTCNQKGMSLMKETDMGSKVWRLVHEKQATLTKHSGKDLSLELCTYKTTSEVWDLCWFAQRNPLHPAAVSSFFPAWMEMCPAFCKHVQVFRMEHADHI